jgi:hypothetical protein
VRLLSWHDNRFEASRVEWVVTAYYKGSAQQLLRGDLQAFATDLRYAGHPPGYAILLATIFVIFGDSNAAIQLTQIIVDCLAAVLIFLIASQLFVKGTAIIAGFLAAISPQFANYSLLLLPDSLSVFPLILAVYLIVRVRRSPRRLTLLMAGASVGLSCWLRANALLLPAFLAVAVLIVFPRDQRTHYAATLLLGALLLIAPLTIKNYLAYQRFIPLSLGAGQKLLEGIAEYDKEGRFGIPRTDLGIMRQEAEMYQRPDYAEELFGVDGIKRDRLRLARGLAVIRAHPFWFVGVMVRRAVSFFRMPRVPNVSPNPPVTHSLDLVERLRPVLSQSAGELIASGRVMSSRGTTSISPDGQLFRLHCDDTKYGKQFGSAQVPVQAQRDYLFKVPFQLEQGRMMISVENEEQLVLASTIIDLDEARSPANQPLNVLAIPFVSGNSTQVGLIFSNAGSSSGSPVAQIGTAELFELGPTSFQWTRYPRLLIRNLQRFFITAWTIPFAACGLLLLLWSRREKTALVLLIVPIYYLCVQSALHTERRYVIAIHYFFLILAAVPLSLLLLAFWNAWLRLLRQLHSSTAT